MTIYFITGNKNKFLQSKKAIAELEQLDIDLPEIQQLDPHQILKAKVTEAIKHHKGQFVVDDTSLVFECLNGLPGPLIKWFLHSIGLEGLFLLTDKLGNSAAQARVCTGYYDGKEIHYIETIVKGKIVSPKGTGFGWDPIFLPDGYEKTYGEWSLAERDKNHIRSLAFVRLRDFLAEK